MSQSASEKSPSARPRSDCPYVVWHKGTWHVSFYLPGTLRKLGLREWVWLGRFARRADAEKVARVAMARRERGLPVTEAACVAEAGLPPAKERKGTNPTGRRWWSTRAGLNVGVWRHRRKWAARVSIGGRWVYLGLFESEWEAARVARRARDAKLARKPKSKRAEKILAEELCQQFARKDAA